MQVKIIRMSSITSLTKKYNYASRIWKMLLGVFLFSIASPLFAQKEVLKRRPYADYRTFHLGFHVGTHVQDLVIANSGFLRNPSSASPHPLFATVSNYTPGFSVGLIVDYTIIQDLELRLQPTLHLSERQITYSDGTQELERLGFRSNIIELPLMLKYSSRRLNNIRPYVIGGVYGGLQIGQRKLDAVRFRPLDYGFRIGVGCDFYLPFFKLCPELSFSFGLPDVIEHNRPDIWEDNRYDYTQAIRRASARLIQLTFNFE